jgi:hypothetical protein
MDLNLAFAAKSLPKKPPKTTQRGQNYVLYPQIAFCKSLTINEREVKQHQVRVFKTGAINRSTIPPKHKISTHGEKSGLPKIPVGCNSLPRRSIKSSYVLKFRGSSQALS